MKQFDGVRNYINKKKGFTLLEVVLVMALLGMLLIIINHFLLDNIRIYKKTSKLQEEQQEVILTKSYLDDKLIFSQKIVSLICEDYTALSGEQGEVSYIVLEAPEFETENRIYNAYTLHLKPTGEDGTYGLYQGYLYLNYVSGNSFEELSNIEKAIRIRDSDTNTLLLDNVASLHVEKINSQTGLEKGIVISFETVNHENANLSFAFKNYKD